VVQTFCPLTINVEFISSGKLASKNQIGIEKFLLWGLKWPVYVSIPFDDSCWCFSSCWKLISIFRICPVFLTFCLLRLTRDHQLRIYLLSSLSLSLKVTWWHRRISCFRIASVCLNLISSIMLLFCFRLKIDFNFQNLSCAPNFLSFQADHQLQIYFQWMLISCSFFSLPLWRPWMKSSIVPPGVQGWSHP